MSLLYSDTNCHSLTVNGIVTLGNMLIWFLAKRNQIRLKKQGK